MSEGGQRERTREEGGLDIRAAGGVLWRPTPAAAGLDGASGASGAGRSGAAGGVAGPATADGPGTGRPGAADGAGRPGSSAGAHGAGGPGWSGGAAELAIVHRPRYDDWSLPKGKLRDGEHPLLAACREVHEETGVRPVVGRRLPEQEYRLGPDRKVVDYWSMSPDPRSPTEFVPNDEVDRIRWVRPAEAGTWLSYDRDRDLLRSFLTVPPATAILLLVRHGRAGDRSAWAGEDRLRPLDAAGRAQADALRRTLRCFGPDRVLSADNIRCVDTVRPLAEDIAVPVETEPALTEAAYDADPARGLRRIRAVVALGDRSVLCSQGGVIPRMVRAFAERGDVRLTEVPARKGSVWALSFVDDRLVAADYYADLDRVLTGPPDRTGPGGWTP
jgi:8-oxo-dGTP pyrophosphatase MutT (NUDIX family)